MSLAIMEFYIIGQLPQRRKYLTVCRKAVALRTWDRSNWSFLQLMAWVTDCPYPTLSPNLSFLNILEKF